MTIAIEAPAGVSGQAKKKSFSFRKSHCDRNFKDRVRLKNENKGLK